MLSLESDEQSENSSEEEIEPVPQPVSKKDKKNQKQASIDDVGDTEEGEMLPKPAQPKSKSKKKGKDKKAEKEEDIDALLAEIEGKSESKQESIKGKKKKKGKVQADIEDMDTEPVDEATVQTYIQAAAQAESTVQLPQAESTVQLPQAESTVQLPQAESTAQLPQAESTVQLPQAGSTAPVDADMAGKDVSEMTQDEIAAWLDNDEYEQDERPSKKKKKKKEKMEKLESEDMAESEGEEDTSTVKTAAQKKKEKKERQKQQKLQQPKKKIEKIEVAADATTAKSEGAEGVKNENDVEQPKIPETDNLEASKEDDAAAESNKKKKKKDKKKKGEEDETEKKKKPSKMARAIQEMQQKIKDEEERQIREEEEKDKIHEEKMRLKEEQERKETERREREKLKKKEKIERLKAEGKYLTAKQKEERRRNEQRLEALKAQGLFVPQPGEKVTKKSFVYGKRKKQGQKKQDDVTPTQTPTEEKQIELVVKDAPEVPEDKEAVKTEEVLDSWEDVKDSWDAESEEETETSPVTETETRSESKEERKEDEESDEESDDEDSEEDSEEDSSDESSDEDEDITPRERALARIQKRKDAAESKRSTDKLRAPVVCVLGHVDTGKTKILDKLRRTHVQDDEAGGITQQIGATNVPTENILEQTKMCKEFTKQEMKLPGLLIIDTPGHESFSNLRTRGSSLCDIAILVIDIMHGLEPQTIESINLLKKGKTPFVVALNKVDRLYQWQSNPHTDIVNTLKKQKMNTRQEFDERVSIATVQLAEQGLNTCLFFENKNPREYISMVPTSAHSGDGMGNLIALVCELTQTMLAKRISLSEELQATVMEVKAIQGLGTTIDVILVNGSICEGDTVVVAGQEGPIVTQVRALLMPQPMKELRVKNAYNKYKEVSAAQGCKIIAKDLEKALAGLPLYIAHKQDEIDYYKEELTEALVEVLASIKLQERGVFVQASTLGSLEALLEFLRTSKIPYAGINIGPVHRKDIMKASIMLEHDSQWAVILAFDVKIEREAQEMADSLGVRIFTADIIYHLFDQFMSHRDQLKKKKQEEFKHVAVFPCKLRVLPQYVFNSRDPIVCGVIIEAGFVKEGMPLCVPSKEFCELGRVTSIENNHKAVDKATKGQEVCIKIEPTPGDTPKLFGRHFDETDLVYSKISRNSIDAVKNYFREEMKKEDWQLVIEMKKLFEIL